MGNTGTPAPPDSLKHPFGMVEGPAGEGLDGYFANVFDFVPVDVPLEETEDWKTADYIAKELEKEWDKPFYLACGIYRPH